MTSLALAFAAGLLSILSPCVLPLVPIVLGAVVGSQAVGGFALAAGVSVSFTGMGLLLALAGFGLGFDSGVLRPIAAVIMILVGILLLMPSWQMRLAPLGAPISNWAEQHSGKFIGLGLAGEFILGLLLGLVWSPCVGPTLGAASLLASQGHGLVRVALTMFVFGIGAALPLTLLGFFSRASLTRLLVAGRLGKGLLGALLIIIGAAIVIGADKRIEAGLVAISPQWLTELTTSL